MAINSRNRARVGGSGYTIFTFMGERIALCEQIQYTSPQPVSGPVAIHPMDARYPVQVVTPGAASMGSLTLKLFEVYNSKVWDRLGGASGGSTATSSQNLSDGILDNAVDIVDIFERIAAQPPEKLNVVKYINPPIIAGQASNAYKEIYHNCVITDVRDGETIAVGTMEVTKEIDVGFTHVTRGDTKVISRDFVTSTTRG